MNHSMEAAATTHKGAATAPNWFAFATGLNSHTLAIIAFFFSIAIVLAYRPWSQIEVGDPAFYDYVAQSILRGKLPYRDIVDIKAPGGAYLSAAAMAIGKWLGLRDVITVRFMGVVLVGLLSATTSLVADLYLRNRFIAVLAFLIPLMPERFAMMLIAGTQPKLPMIIFGMITLLLIARDRPFWAGFCSMLSCLCWQPGLLFTGAAVLIFSRYLTTWRDGRAAKVVVGASIPLLSVLGYFNWKGALGDLWAWTITYNFSVFGPEAKKSFSEAIGSVWTVIVRVFRPEPAALGDRMLDPMMSRFETVSGLIALATVPASLIGLLGFGLARARAKLNSRRSLDSPDLFTDALVIAPAVYLGFCLINFQAGADLIPLFPFIGIFAGLFIFKLGAFAASLWTRKKPLIASGALLIPWIALALILVIILYHAVTFREDAWPLKSQDNEIKAISELLGPDDKIYVHGTSEILVLLNRPNLNPYLLLDWDADTFAASRKPGGWTAIMDEMEAEAPKIVAITRLRAVTHRVDIERWVNDRYERLGLSRYDRVFIRKQR
jgi:hypothetical protein